MTVQQFVHSSRASSIPAEVPSVPWRRGVRLAERGEGHRGARPPPPRRISLPGSAVRQPADVGVANRAGRLRAGDRPAATQADVVTRSADHDPRPKGLLSDVESESRLQLQSERAAAVVADDRLPIVEDDSPLTLVPATEREVRRRPLVADDAAVGREHAAGWIELLLHGEGHALRWTRERRYRCDRGRDGRRND